jgi:hypothetical protein
MRNCAPNWLYLQDHAPSTGHEININSIIIIIGSTALGEPWHPLEVSLQYFFTGWGC